MHQPLHHVVVDVGKERTNDVLDLVEPFRAEQHRLVMRDVVGLNTHPANIKRAQLGLLNLLDLPVRREQPGAVGADRTVLAYHTELRNPSTRIRMVRL